MVFKAFFILAMNGFLIGGVFIGVGLAISSKQTGRNLVWIGIILFSIFGYLKSQITRQDSQVISVLIVVLPSLIIAYLSYKVAKKISNWRHLRESSKRAVIRQEASDSSCFSD